MCAFECVCACACVRACVCVCVCKCVCKCVHASVRAYNNVYVWERTGGGGMKLNKLEWQKLENRKSVKPAKL